MISELAATVSIKYGTDEHTGYRTVGKSFAKHEFVTHSNLEYVRGDAHVNTAECAFSLLKRGVYGTFHHISRKYTPLYLAEFDHRFNTRKMSDGDRTVVGLKAEGKRLYYRRPKSMYQNRII